MFGLLFLYFTFGSLWALNVLPLSLQTRVLDFVFFLYITSFFHPYGVGKAQVPVQTRVCSLFNAFYFLLLKEKVNNFPNTLHIRSQFYENGPKRQFID